MLEQQTVAIVVCFYNNQDTLLKSLQSLQMQTYALFKCFLIDDGSEDQSSTIAQEFCNLDARFAYFRKEHSGPGASRNFAFDMIKRDEFRYLSFLDADDFVALNKLEIQISELNADTETALVACVSKDYPLDEYQSIGFSQVIDYECTKHSDSFFDLLTSNFKFHPASSLIDLSRIDFIPRNTNHASGQDYKFFLDIFYQNPHKKIIVGDFYIASVRINSVQRVSDAKLNSALARYQSALFYQGKFQDKQSILKLNFAIDRYLSWISYQTQLYYGYREGIFEAMKQQHLYKSKINYLNALLHRLFYFSYFRKRLTKI